MSLPILRLIICSDQFGLGRVVAVDCVLRYWLPRTGDVYVCRSETSVRDGKMDALAYIVIVIR